MWRVIHAFYDLKDNNHYYEVGTSFPRKGKEVSDERLAFLASDKNLLRTPVIEKVSVSRKKKQEA